MHVYRRNITRDVEGLPDLVWYDFGKVQSVTVDRAGYDDYTNSYEYAAEGTRVIKSISKTVGADETRETTNYVIDPSGNPVSIYRATREFDSGMETSREIIQKEIPLYGSSRYGSYMLSRDIEETLVQEYSYNPLDQRFELSNHLGNVLTTYTARKMGIDDDSDGIVEYYEAEVVTARDYYPYGLEMLGEADITPTNPVSGRVYHNPTFLDDGYRYGFNGKERDPEFHEEVTNYDYGFRIYNPGIARFLSVDPLTSSYPSWTPYAFTMNRPIDGVDLDGLEYIDSKTGTYYSDAYTLPEISVVSSPLPQGFTRLVNRSFSNDPIMRGIRARLSQGDYTFQINGGLSVDQSIARIEGQFSKEVKGLVLRGLLVATAPAAGYAVGQFATMGGTSSILASNGLGSGLLSGGVDLYAQLSTSDFDINQVNLTRVLTSSVFRNPFTSSSLGSAFDYSFGRGLEFGSIQDISIETFSGTVGGASGNLFGNSLKLGTAWAQGGEEIFPQAMSAISGGSFGKAVTSTITDKIRSQLGVQNSATNTNDQSANEREIRP